MLELFQNRIVVVPWDFSELSRLALDLTAKSVPADQIRVVCVLEAPDPMDPAAIWGNATEEEAQEFSRAKFEEQYPPTEYPELKFVPMFGDPATQIVNYAKDEKAGVIVISSHGRSGVKRLLLGSVAERVIRTANCPTVLIPHEWAEGGQQASANSDSAS